MALEFVVPPLFQNIRDFELNAKRDKFHVEEVTDLSNCDKASQEDFVGALTQQLLGCTGSGLVHLIGNAQDVFDGLYSGVRYVSDLAEGVRVDLVELLLSCGEHLLRELKSFSVSSEQAEYRNAFKIVVYFLCKLLFDMEKCCQYEACVQKSKGTGIVQKDASWSRLRIRLLVGIRQTLWDEEWVDLGKLWQCGLPETEFLNLYWQLSETILLEKADMVSKDEQVRVVVLELIELVAHRFYTSLSHVMISAFAHSLMKHEKFNIFLATIMQDLSAKFDDTRFSRALLLEIGRLDLERTGRDLSGVKLVGSFVDELSKRLPEVVFANLSVLLPHFNAEAYPIRVSLVKSISQLILYLKVESAKQANCDESKGSTERDTNTRDKLFDLLGERVHDTSSYVRAAALISWAQLGSKSAIPLTYFGIATDVCIERIHDKSSIVRKQAISTLCQLILCNPYNATLSAAAFNKKIAQTETWLKECESEVDMGAKASKLDFLRYCKDALQFIAKVEDACEAVKRLQCSKTMSDVLECMRFLSILYKFNIEVAKHSIKGLFVLIWDTRESGRIRKELLETFEQIYISPSDDKLSEKRVPYPPHVIASNIVALASNSSLAELTSLEKILSESVKNDGILGRRILPYSVIDHLWEIASMRSDVGSEDVGDINVEEIDKSCRSAMCILAALSSSKACQISKASSFDAIQTIGFGKGAKERCDYGMSRYAFLSMIRCIQFQKSHTAFDPGQVRLMIGNIKEVLTWEWEKLPTRNEQPNQIPSDQWFPAAEQAVKLLFEISEEPEHICSSILQRNHKQVFDTISPDMGYLSRFVFLLGHIAVKMCILGEKIASEMKKARAEANNQSNETSEEGSGLLEMNAGGDDFEDGIVRRLLEMSEPSLLTSYVPCLICILSGKYTVSADLKASAATTLCRLMSVSEALCESHLPFVLTVLRDAKEFGVRANIIISLGDLASRFPNVVEPYTRHIYKSLRDKDCRVRKNTLMVLTHLILNDMVKIRGEVSELAVCLEDEDERVRDLAGLFFTELSKRGSNPVYNLMPDTLASLSRSVDSAQFERISKFLLSFLSGEKKIISTVEKLCLRIFAACGVTHDETIVPESTEHIKQIRDLAFCLAQLKYGEKSLRKLSEDFFKHYQPVLADKKVFNSFQSIAKKSRQVMKSENAKHLLEEWSRKLEETHDAQAENVQSLVKARGQVEPQKKFDSNSNNKVDSPAREPLRDNTH